MVEIFGEERLANLDRRVEGLSSVEREQVIMDEMKNALRDGGAKFVIEFRFLNDRGTRTSHYIIHACKHVRGHEEMKRQMHKQRTGSMGGAASFEFCPPSAGKLALDDRAGNLRAQLLVDFQGRQLSMQDLYEEHHPNRPLIDKDYKQALVELEMAGSITCSPRADKRPKRKGTPTCGPKTIVTFPD